MVDAVAKSIGFNDRFQYEANALPDISLLTRPDQIPMTFPCRALLIGWLYADEVDLNGVNTFSFLLIFRVSKLGSYTMC